MNITIEGFGYPDTLIKEYKHWVVLLRTRHVTIGSLILVAKSEVTSLGDLTTEEWAEFKTVSNEMEALLKKVFNPDKFNYLALMMKDPNVHFHFIPRYSKPVEINGKKFVDVDWPGSPELKPLDITREELELVKSKLIDAL